VPYKTTPTSTYSIGKRKRLHTPVIQDEPHPAYQKNNKQMTVKVLQKVYAALHLTFTI
jgi:hypothetical protein